MALQLCSPIVIMSVRTLVCDRMSAVVAWMDGATGPGDGWSSGLPPAGGTNSHMFNNCLFITYMHFFLCSSGFVARSIPLDSLRGNQRGCLRKV